MSERSFSTVFAYALQGHPCAVVGLEDGPAHVPVGEWTRAADTDDLSMLDLCEGPTIDIGCGPGRMVSALAERGVVALGIDVVHEAIGLTLARGASALRRDVYDDLPGEGRWHTALLADGNVGIGGHPVQLLRRVRELLDPRGRTVVELAPPGVASKTVWATLECNGDTSRPFRWAVLGMDDIEAVASDAGLVVAATSRHGDRWCATLTEPA